MGSLPETGPPQQRSFLEIAGVDALCRPGEERRFGSRTPGPGAPRINSRAGYVQPWPWNRLPDALRVTARRLPQGTIYLITNESESWVDAAREIPGG